MVALGNMTRGCLSLTGEAVKAGAAQWYKGQEMRRLKQRAAAWYAWLVKREIFAVLARLYYSSVAFLSNEAITRPWRMT